MSISTASNRQAVDEREVPVPGSYALDPSHSEVGFVARHLVVAKVRGRFGAFSGTVNIAEDPAESSVDVSIDAASIDTRDDTRDAHLRSPDFLDTEQFPTLSYSGSQVRAAGGGRWTVDGELTVRGVTRPVPLEVVFEGGVTDPWGNERAVFSATTEIDREDFGLTWNQALESGGVLVGKKVVIEIEAEAVRQG